MARLIALAVAAVLLAAACQSVAPPASAAPPDSSPVASASIEPTATPAHTATTPPTPATPSTPTEPPTVTPSPAPTPSASPATPAPQPTPRPPRIRVFSAPAFVDCSVDPEPLQIRLEWEIRRGTGVTLSIDGPGLYATYEGRSGAADVPFSCSENEHAYQLTTFGGVGEPDTALRVVRRTQPG